MGRSKNLTYQCDLCQYASGRKGNAKRHNILVHKGNASLSLLNILTSTRTPVDADSKYMTFFDKNRSNNDSTSSVELRPKNKPVQNQDIVDQTLKEFEEWTELINRMHRIFRPIGGHSNWSIPQPGLNWPQQSWNTATSNSQNTQQPTVSRRLGFLGFVCKNCDCYGLEEVVGVYTENKMITIRYGNRTHVCSTAKDKVEGSPETNPLYEFELLMYKALTDWIGSDKYLYIEEVGSALNQGIPQILNPIDFGQAHPEDPIYPAIKNGATNLKLSLKMLSDFVSKAKASYCLATFEEEGKKRRFLMLINTVPAGSVNSKSGEQEG